MKKKNSTRAIFCYPTWGPVFGNNYSVTFGNNYPDISIGDYCNEEGSCYINPLNAFQYECHPEYKSSLYVNTNDPDYVNYFSVLDYEVYTSNYSF